MTTRKFSVLSNELTITEVRILILDTHCNVRKEVAAILDCSPSTVDTHIRNIYRKYDLKGQRDLQRFAYDNGFYNKGFFSDEYLFEGLEGLPW
ncbi:helix-turn-helix transcriptional regulator [Flavobacteriales bacterium]|nr:helix-turn-helix transcriptional regulator [Flavobacteriales bacterium]